jgi:hypothetical protein
MAYLTIFRVHGGICADLFVYWAMEDARLATVHHQPQAGSC